MNGRLVEDRTSRSGDTGRNAQSGANHGRTAPVIRQDN
jgi:hypothetical protein